MKLPVDIERRADVHLAKNSTQNNVLLLRSSLVLFLSKCFAYSRRTQGLSGVSLPRKSKPAYGIPELQGATAVEATVPLTCPPHYHIIHSLSPGEHLFCFCIPCTLEAHPFTFPKNSGRTSRAHAGDRQRKSCILRVPSGLVLIIITGDSAVPFPRRRSSRNIAYTRNSRAFHIVWECHPGRVTTPSFEPTSKGKTFSKPRPYIRHSKYSPRI